MVSQRRSGSGQPQRSAEWQHWRMRRRLSMRVRDISVMMMVAVQYRSWVAAATGR